MKTSKKSQDNSMQFTNEELKIGFVLTIAVFLIIGITISRMLHQTPKQSVAGSKISLAANPTATPKAESKQVIALKNDSFWEISKRACGTGKYYEQIKKDNGYTNKALHSGDIITINCSKY